MIAECRGWILFGPSSFMEDSAVPINDASCLYSTLKNVSGERQVFSFLPPHGRPLEANEEFTVLGTPIDAVSNGVNRVASRRNLESLEQAVQDGLLEVISTPSPILQSPSGTVKMLHLADNGTLSAVDPCWKTEVLSESVDVH